MTKTLSKITSSILAVAILALGSIVYAADYSNDFEVDTFDWVGVTQVASGVNGITSANGAFHGEATNNAYTQWGGYESVFPTYGYSTQVDVYLDMDLATGVNDDQFDFSSAINTPAGAHRRDFIFSLGTDPNNAGQWLASVSNNSIGWPGNPARNPATITETGWYTLKSTFEDVAGVLEVTMEIINESDTVVGSWVLTDASDIIGVTVGGNRYGWFVGAAFEFPWLAIDNAIKTELPEPPCAPQYDVVGPTDVQNTDTSEYFDTLQDAIDDCDTVDGNTIDVADGIYTEDVTVNKELTLEGNELSTIEGQMRIEASNVTVNGFTFDAGPTSEVVLLRIPGTGNNVSNVAITNNVFENMDVLSNNDSAAMTIESSNGTLVEGNIFQNLTTENAGTNRTMQGILIGDTGQSDSLADITINDNVFTNIAGGRGAYGLIVNRPVTGLEITNNVIDGITGNADSAGSGWASGIGLDADTPDAVVRNNVIANVTSLVNDAFVAMGVIGQSAAAAESITIEYNDFLTAKGAENRTDGVVDYSLNWWGSITGPSVYDVTLASYTDNEFALGGTVITGVGGATGDVVIEPWLCGPFATSPETSIEGSCVSLTASPEEAYNFIGDDHTVTADIGLAQADVSVHFDVSGVSSDSGDVLTDENGVAEFTFSSDTAGIDTITACVDYDASATCEAYEPSVDVFKYWYDGKVSGGGHILEETGKRKDWKDVSFGGGVYDLGVDGIVGDWIVQFHNVSENSYDKTTFEATSFTALNFFDGNATVCDDAVNFTALGTLDDEAGWKLVIRGGDLKGPASDNLDTLRVSLYQGNTLKYDTTTDFPSSANCVGTARTTIDNGNLKIER